MSSPDTLFGIPIPTTPPVGVFPYDPDFGFKRGRQWNTKVFPFSPLLEQRFIMNASPLITWQIGFAVMKGDFDQTGTVFTTLWDFFNAHLARGVPFYYYDPVYWKRYPAAQYSHGGVNYRDDPTQRINHPGGLSGAEAGYSATYQRYIMLFADDEMSYELFDRRLRKTELSIQGVPG